MTRHNRRQSRQPKGAATDEVDSELNLHHSGMITFYGLYWSKEHVFWEEKQLLGLPKGWMGKGKIAKNFDWSLVQMNFWKQKGVYLLYDDNLNVVYAGQAGTTKSESSEFSNIGERLYRHRRGRYRNGWSLFSWFGFLTTSQINLRTANEDQRINPNWVFNNKNQSMKNLLSSFEAVLIEGFAPRFNARGGDLKGATIVDQYEPEDDE